MLRLFVLMKDQASLYYYNIYSSMVSLSITRVIIIIIINATRYFFVFLSRVTRKRAQIYSL